MHELKGKVALVAGATRGAGRGIACMLGEAGATVYCTGRSSRAHPSSLSQARPETIEETAELVSQRGGKGIARRVDHTIEREVQDLFQHIQEKEGKLDILVNDVWGGDALAEWGKPFWELDMQKGFLMMDRAIRSHIMASRYGVPLMVKQGSGLIVEITDGDALTNISYRGNLFYDVSKVSPMRVAFDMAHELRDTSIVALSLTPGFLRSEAVLEHFGVSESNWRDAIQQDPHFEQSESPFYIGKAIAALAADPLIQLKAGKSYSSGELAHAYGLQDIDGSQPYWNAYYSKNVNLFWEKMNESLQKAFGQKNEHYSIDKTQMQLLCQLPSKDQNSSPFTYPLSGMDVFYGDSDKIAQNFHRQYQELKQKSV